MSLTVIEGMKEQAAPPIPAELWMLLCPGDDPDDPHPAHWLLSLDNARDGQTYLVAFSEAEAKAAAEHQANLYGHETTPVRVK